jgi:hypothetical protein
MTHGIFLSVASVLAILATVALLVVLSSSVLRMEGIPGRRVVALFWGCPAGTWLVAVVATAAILSIR